MLPPVNGRHTTLNKRFHSEMFQFTTSIATALAGMSLTLLSWGQSIRFDEVVIGLSSPSMLTSPPDDDRLFICERILGRALVFDQGALLPTPFLDLGGNISTNGERGLLGLAFHPNFVFNRFVFVSFTDTTGASVVARYTVSAFNPNVIDPATEQVVFGPLTQINAIHNGGCIVFAADGKLLLSLGDDGNHRNGQMLSVPYGKILRFDVDAPFPHVPQDNPFVGQPNHEPLIWAYGLRNPWRISVDRLTGDLWISDLGTNQRDEVSFLSAGAPGGANFGWSCREGNHCTTLIQTGCVCTDPALIPPVYERIPQSVGCALIGGHLYRGQEVPSMYGRYLMTDWCGGALTSFAWTGNAARDVVVNHGITPTQVQATSLSEGPGGELYMTDMLRRRVLKLVTECNSNQYCTATPNSTGAVGQIALSGSASVSTNDFTLVATQLPPTALTMFITSLSESFVTNPGGSQGNICLGTTGLARFQLLAGPTGGTGRYAVLMDLNALPTTPPQPVHPGETWRFQAWHRDMNPSATSNFTRGLSVTFCP